jgi:hypothetical protein
MFLWIKFKKINLIKYKIKNFIHNFLDSFIIGFNIQIILDLIEYLSEKCYYHRK